MPLNEDVEDLYMHGYCMFLAAALHHEYGFPLGILTVEVGGKEVLSHAWVVVPGGHLDIRGTQTLDGVTSFQEGGGGKYRVIVPTTLSHLEELTGIPLPSDYPDVADAMGVAELHLDRLTNSTESTEPTATQEYQ